MSGLASKRETLLHFFMENYVLDKKSFLDEFLSVLFQVIPEVQKGSIFELEDDYYLPVVYYGYDPKVINILRFKSDTVFGQYDDSQTASLTVHMSKIPSRVNDPLLSAQTKTILRQLGTLNELYCIYAPIKHNRRTIGMVCLDKFDNDDFSDGSMLLLKYFSHLVSEYYTEEVNFAESIPQLINML